MAVHVNHAPEVTSLQLQLERTLARINDALDTGDRRAFRAWCGRHASLTARIATLLHTIVTAEE